MAFPRLAVPIASTTEPKNTGKGQPTVLFNVITYYIYRMGFHGQVNKKLANYRI